MTVRETRFRVEQPGFRSRSIVVVTTLLDPEETTKEDLAQLFRARWNQELDLRSIKSTMQMDMLRCKTPELVRKEIWTHILANNLIRTVMAQAASKHDVKPRTISFKAALQTVEAFQPLIAFQGDRGRSFRLELYQQLLTSSHFIESPTGPIALNLDSRSEESDSTALSPYPGTRRNSRSSKDVRKSKCHSSFPPRRLYPTFAAEVDATAARSTYDNSHRRFTRVVS